MSNLLEASKMEYERAIKQLNTLFRSERLTAEIQKDEKAASFQIIPNMYRLLNALSITQADLDNLGVIHVTGTKGKGSTCAYTESILRHCGFKTFTFSSPHVREVRERIALNGQPLSYASFAAYFWEIYDQLKHFKDDDNTLMQFYGFLSVMGIYVAVKEKQLGNVEAVIIEGMVGGEYDYVNIFNVKAVCGVTSLGLDHTAVLGNTIEEIAWHKGGIFRKGVPVLTSPQPEEAMKVLQDRAAERGAVLNVSPPLGQFGSNIELRMTGTVQRLNAALAIQLARTWIEWKDAIRNNTIGNGSTIRSKECTSTDSECIWPVDPITEAERKGLKSCVSMGKDHVVRLEGMTFYLDGAHTLESLQYCIEWFENKSIEETMDFKSPSKKILVFGASFNRSKKRLMSPLKDYPFDVVLFPVNMTDEQETSIDHPNVNPGVEKRIEDALLHKEVWDELHRTEIQNGAQEAIFCRSLADSVRWMTDYRLRMKEGSRSPFLHVLVTGGVSLIGKYLRFLDTVNTDAIPE